jgi:hypothetical protein
LQNRPEAAANRAAFVLTDLPAVWPGPTCDVVVHLNGGLERPLGARSWTPMLADPPRARGRTRYPGYPPSGSSQVPKSKSFTAPFTVVTWKVTFKLSTVPEPCWTNWILNVNVDTPSPAER